jgi:hypothetical protein
VGQSVAALKQMRIVHVVFLLAVLLFVLQAELLAGEGQNSSPAIPIAIALIGIIDVYVAYFIRRTRLYPALGKLRRDPNDSDGLKQWRSSTLVSLVLALTIGLYGFALRFFGVAKYVSWLFYLASLILMLLWRPQLDLSGEGLNT